MFTGLIEHIGTIVGIRARPGGGGELSIRIDDWDEPPQIGESIAVQGICLTVKKATRNGFDCDLLQETLARTNLGRRRPGARVNLERALRAGDRLGGHLVSGHIDGLGLCAAIHRMGPDYALSIRAAHDLIAGIVPKGSIACDGVSLTVAQLESERFSVHIIPHTWQATTLHQLHVGDRVNLETDMIGKHAARAEAPQPPSFSGMTMETLRRSGFAG